MKTYNINEQECRDSLVKAVKEMNERLHLLFEKKEKEYGLPGVYAGGLSMVPCSEGLSLQSNINNLLAVFNNNFAESVFFQLNNRKLKHALNTLQDYLTDRGLLDDYHQFKESRQLQDINLKPTTDE